MTTTDNDLVPAREIDWLRSTTTTTVQRTKATMHEPKVRVEHVAMFSIERGYVTPAIKAEYSVQPFLPEFMVATWVDGNLARVALSGKRLLKDGRSGKESRDREWGRFSDDPINRDNLPGKVAEALATYELAVATLTGGAR